MVRGADLDRAVVVGTAAAAAVSCKSISSRNRKSSNSCSNPSILASARCILAVALFSSGDDDDVGRVVRRVVGAVVKSTLGRGAEIDRVGGGRCCCCAGGEDAPNRVDCDGGGGCGDVLLLLLILCCCGCGWWRLLLV